MNATIELNFMAVLLLVFTLSLSKRHLSRNPRYRYFMLSVATTIILLLSEIISHFLLELHVSSYILPHRLLNVVGFGLSPCLTYFLIAYVNYPLFSPVMKKLLRIPLYVNASLSVLSYWNGWLFFVDASNRYTRGPFFGVTTFVTFAYFCIVVYGYAKGLKSYELPEKGFFISIILLPLLGVLLQIVHPEILALWSSIALSLLLFYIFSLEQSFSYDSLTGLRNRTTFIRDLSKAEKEHIKHSCFFVFDLNNLKKVNDLYGHAAGDDLINSTAKVLYACFNKKGYCYRVGGDEFCVMCKNLGKEKLAEVLSSFEVLLAQENTRRNIPLEVAYGYACNDGKDATTLFQSYSEADTAMYRHKAKYKQQTYR